MGKVLQLNNSKARPKEFSPEEERLVEKLYRSIGAVAKKYDDVIVCKAIAVYMGTMMTETKRPGEVIGGFMNHIQHVANLAIAVHKRKENQNAPKVYGVTNENGQAGPQDADAAQGSDRDLEVQEGQEVLRPPALEQREGDVPIDAGVRPPSGLAEDGPVDD